MRHHDRVSVVAPTLAFLVIVGACSTAYSQLAKFGMAAAKALTGPTTVKIVTGAAAVALGNEAWARVKGTEHVEPPKPELDVKPDGTIVFSDGTYWKRDGTLGKPDGKVFKPRTLNNDLWSVPDGKIPKLDALNKDLWSLPQETDLLKRLATGASTPTGAVLRTAARPLFPETTPGGGIRPWQPPGGAKFPPATPPPAPPPPPRDSVFQLVKADHWSTIDLNAPKVEFVSLGFNAQFFADAYLLNEQNFNRWSNWNENMSPLCEFRRENGSRFVMLNPGKYKVLLVNWAKGDNGCTLTLDHY